MISIRWLVAPGRRNRPTAPTKALAHSLSRRASAGRSSTTRFLTREMSSSSVSSTTCDVFRFMFQLDEEAEERIEFICKMDLIGRSIAAAVAENLAGPLLRRSALSKRIPAVSLRKLLLNPHIRDGNIPALFADLTQEYGPVFEIRPPFAKPMIILGGPETNHWVHRRGRMYLRTRDYFATSRKSTARREYCLPWMAPIISGFASHWGRRIHAGDWKGSWISSIAMPGHIWRIGVLETPFLRQAYPGEGIPSSAIVPRTEMRPAR